MFFSGIKQPRTQCFCHGSNNCNTAQSLATGATNINNTKSNKNAITCYASNPGKGAEPAQQVSGASYCYSSVLIDTRTNALIRTPMTPLYGALFMSQANVFASSQTSCYTVSGATRGANMKMCLCSSYRCNDPSYVATTTTAPSTTPKIGTKAKASWVSVVFAAFIVGVSF